MSSPSTTERGQWAENLAAQNLTAQGLKPIQRNYRYRWGEIDLIMRDRQTLVFVQVRFRAGGINRSAAQSVDTRKQHKLINTAEHYLQSQPGLRDPPAALMSSVLLTQMRTGLELHSNA